MSLNRPRFFPEVNMSANEPVNKLRVSARPVARIDEQLEFTTPRLR